MSQPADHREPFRRSRVRVFTLADERLGQTAPDLKLPPATLSVEEARRLTELLEAIGEDRRMLSALTEDERKRFLAAAGPTDLPGPRRQVPPREGEPPRSQGRQARSRPRGARVDRDPRAPPRRGVLRPAQGAPETGAGPGRPRARAQDPRNCYVCKQEYRKLHFFYDAMCIPCAEDNYAKRFPKADLRGKVALLTGARVKIGFQASLMLLRAGATVIVTTRFPKDAALRYAREPDFGEWGHGSRSTGSTCAIRRPSSCSRATSSRPTTALDILINNAGPDGAPAARLLRPPARRESGRRRSSRSTSARCSAITRSASRRSPRPREGRRRRARRHRELAQPRPGPRHPRLGGALARALCARAGGRRAPRLPRGPARRRPPAGRPAHDELPGA